MENKSPGLNEVGILSQRTPENADVTNNLNDGTKCTLNKFADDRKWRLMADTSN